MRFNESSFTGEVLQMISVVKSDKMTTQTQFDCEIECCGETHKGKCERCPKTGDLRVCLESTDSFGDDGDCKLPDHDLATLRLLDGSGSEYHGSFDSESGKFTTAS